MGFASGGDGHRQRHRGLAHRGARRKDDEVARLEARGVFVDVAEARGDAGAVAVAVIELVDLLEGAFEQFVDRHELARALAPADLVDDLFAAIERAVDILFGLEADLRNHRAGVDQPAQRGFLAHDPRVILRRRRRRHGLHQRGEIRQPADAFEQIAPPQFLRDGDLIERLAAIVQLQERGEDRLVSDRVEVDGRDDLADRRHHLAIDEDRPDHGHLGLEILRRDPVGVADPAIRTLTVAINETARLPDAECRQPFGDILDRYDLDAARRVARTSRSFSLGMSTRRMPAWRAA